MLSTLLWWCELCVNSYYITCWSNVYIYYCFTVEWVNSMFEFVLCLDVCVAVQCCWQSHACSNTSCITTLLTWSKHSIHYSMIKDNFNKYYRFIVSALPYHLTQTLSYGTVCPPGVMKVLREGSGQDIVRRTTLTDNVRREKNNLPQTSNLNVVDRNLIWRKILRECT